MSNARAKMSARSRVLDMADPIEAVSEKTVRKATGKKAKGGMTVGRFVRRQYTFYPETLHELAVAAAEYGVAETEMARWCMEYGLAALRRGEGPEIVTSQVRHLARPDGG